MENQRITEQGDHPGAPSALIAAATRRGLSARIPADLGFDSIASAWRS